ncbi:MAG: DNA polymerase III subunit delta [Clostridia bacterium]|nr:DNA polymerase III subunit delta [Clostridia bacterium]
MITIENLEKKLKDNELNNIYLLYGEERYLLETIVKKIKNKFGQIIKGINYLEIDEDNIEQLIPNIETPAFGFEKKLIIIKNTNIFKREVKKKSIKVSEEKDKIIKYLQNNKEVMKVDVIMVFIEETVDKGKMLTALEELGAIICKFEYQKISTILSRLKSICKAYKVTAEDNTLKYFIENVGTNMQDVINEIRKQIEYVGERGIITNQTIDILVTKHLEGVIFDLTDNLGKRDIKQAMLVLNNLLYAKEPIQKVLITLYNHFKKLYITKLSIKYNKNIVQTLELKPNQLFLITKYKIQAEQFKEKELKEILEKLIDLDYKYKTGLIDINIGLEAILCTYCS